MGYWSVWGRVDDTSEAWSSLLGSQYVSLNNSFYEVSLLQRFKTDGTNEMDEKKYLRNIHMYVKYCGIIKYMWWPIFVYC